MFLSMITMFVKHDYTARKHANNARKAYLQCSYHDNSGPNHDHHNHNHSTHDHHGHTDLDDDTDDDDDDLDDGIEDVHK